MLRGEIALDHCMNAKPARSAISRLFSRLLAISPSESRFERRGFLPTPASARLERAGTAFIAGHNEAVQLPGPDALLAMLAALPAADRGFFAEGAAMGAAIRTACPPWRNALSPLLDALAKHYVHLAHVGVGWAIARLPFARRRLTAMLDPMLAPLALDGRGFHDGYFHSGAVAGGWRALSGASGRVYDQGIGRSLWFSQGADPERIAAVVTRLDGDRHADLWAGVGLASVYAGGAPHGAIDRLAAQAGPALRWLRQGAAFAIGAHARAGAVPAEAEAAAQRMCGMEAAQLAGLVDEAFAAALRDDLPQPARYQGWRRRVAAGLEGRLAA